MCHHTDGLSRITSEITDPNVFDLACWWHHASLRCERYQVWMSQQAVVSIVTATAIYSLGGHIGANWRIRLNRPSAAAMRHYVKLLWPVLLLLGRIVVLHTYMRPIVTDRVAWSVGLSQYCEPCRNGWTDQDAVWIVDLGGPRSCCAPFGEGEGIGNHLTQCCLGRGLTPYQMASWSIQPFRHTYGSKLRAAVSLFGQGAGSPSNTR